MKFIDKALPNKNIIDKNAIANAFGRAANGYDSAAKLQQSVGYRLLSHFYPLAERIKEPLTILDAGAGTGFLSQTLKNYFNDSHHLTALDLSEAMLNHAKERNVAHQYYQGDIENLPFNDQQFHFSLSNLAIQWCFDFERAIAELVRVIKEEGALIFTTILDGSLHQLDQAWSHIDGHKHTLPFLNYEEVNDHLLPYKHHLICFEETLNFPSIMPLLRSLKDVGATTINREQQGLMGRNILDQLSQYYPKNSEGEFPLTYRLALGVIYR